MVFVNHWYILWSQIKFYVNLTLPLKSKYEPDGELKRNNHLGKQHSGDVTVCSCFNCAVKQTEKEQYGR